MLSSSAQSGDPSIEMLFVLLFINVLYCISGSPARLAGKSSEDDNAHYNDNIRECDDN